MTRSSRRIGWSSVPGIRRPAWTLITRSETPQPNGGLGLWNTAGLADGVYTLRLVLETKDRGELSTFVTVSIGSNISTNATPTASPTATPTATARHTNFPAAATDHESQGNETVTSSALDGGTYGSTGCSTLVTVSVIGRETGSDDGSSRMTQEPLPPVVHSSTCTASVRAVIRQQRARPGAGDDGARERLPVRSGDRHARPGAGPANRAGSTDATLAPLVGYDGDAGAGGRFPRST